MALSMHATAYLVVSKPGCGSLQRVWFRDYPLSMGRSNRGRQ